MKNIYKVWLLCLAVGFSSRIIGSLQEEGFWLSPVKVAMLASRAAEIKEKNLNEQWVKGFTELSLEQQINLWQKFSPQEQQSYVYKSLYLLSQYEDEKICWLWIFFHKYASEHLVHFLEKEEWASFKTSFLTKLIVHGTGVRGHAFVSRLLAERWDNLQSNGLAALLYYLSSEQVVRVIQEKWESLEPVVAVNFIKKLFKNVPEECKREKIWWNKLLQKGKAIKTGDDPFFWTLFFESLDIRDRDECARKVLEDKDFVTECPCVIPYMAMYLKNKDTVEKILLFDCLPPSLSKKHVLDNTRFFCTSLPTSKPAIRELCIRMMNYQYDQEKLDRVVYFHGQAWYWQKYTKIFHSLYELKYGKINEKFVFLRFELNYISPERVAYIHKYGVTAFKDARKDLLFSNRSLFANYSGSNTVYYVEHNRDMSTTEKRNLQEFGKLFAELGYQEVFKKLQTERPDLLEKYSQLHTEASQFGNFIVVTMPRETAAKISYCAEVGGPKLGTYNRYEKGGTWMGWAKDKLGFEHTIPFVHEYCIVLGPTILDPAQAKEAGIEITEYNAADPEVMAQRDAVLAEIVEFVKQASKADKK